MNKAPIQRSRHPRVERLLAEVPGYAVAQAIADRAEAAARAIDDALPAPQPRPATADAVTDEWLSAEANRLVTASTAAAQKAALLEIAETANADAGILATQAGEEDLLIALAKELDDVVRRVRTAVDNLGGAATAQEAIDAGTAVAWAELTELQREYADIRAAADVVYAATHDQLPHLARSDDPDLEASALRWANLDQVAPYWRRSPRTSGGAQLTIPWPSDPVEALAWLLREGAIPWIPTPREAWEHLNTRDQDVRSQMTDDALAQARGNQPTGSTTGPRLQAALDRHNSPSMFTSG